MDPALEAFRGEARAWFDGNFPPSLKGQGALMMAEGPGSEDPDFKLWKQRMGDRGWGVPTWPAAYGGGGLNLAETRVLREEMARIGAWNPKPGFQPIFLLKRWPGQPMKCEGGDRSGAAR